MTKKRPAPATHEDHRAAARQEAEEARAKAVAALRKIDLRIEHEPAFVFRARAG